VISVFHGSSPIILAMPHGGTFVPKTIAAQLNDRGRALSDTDWHIRDLYRDLLPSASTVEANFHRYVIDANRGPDDASLYPGQNTTGLCPLTDFDGHDIWDHPPDAAEIAARTAQFHAPYHAALRDQISRVQAQFGVAILFDCHSIRSNIPYLFDGELPVFNIGTNSGDSCANAVTDAVMRPCLGQNTVLNGRFKGGWTTRHYGQPAQGVHAIQMEIAQRAYLQTEAAPWEYDAKTAAPTRAILAQVLHDLDTLARAMTGN
jgi:formiminoglutamase